MAALFLITAAALSPSATTPPGFPPSLKPGCLAPDAQRDLFCPGDGGYGCYKIPTLLRHSSGALLAFIEARKYSCDDQGFVDLRLRRSFDSGATWEPSRLVHGDSNSSAAGRGGPPWTTVGDAQVVEDSSSGAVWMLHTRNNSRLFLSRSDDVGATWSAPEDVSSLRRGGGTGTGHAGGIELSAGPHRGRLLLPIYSGGPYAVYSDDHGASWRAGEILNHTAGVETTGAGEWAIAETGAYGVDGTPLLLGSRRNSPKTPAVVPGSGKGHRLQALSRDGGVTWGREWEARELPEPVEGCEGALIFHPGTRKLYFSHPDPALDLFRTQLRVWTSGNLGATWESHAVVWPGAAGYSSLVVLGNASDADVGVFYDRNNHTMAVFEAQSVSFTAIAA